MEQAGYVVQQEFDFLDRQSFIVFGKRQAAERSRSALGPMTALLDSRFITALLERRGAVRNGYLAAPLGRESEGLALLPFSPSS
jgi:hypothetical protein